MNTEEMQAMKRLLKKLSALRATLSDEERALLDEFIVTPKADEVVAQKFDQPFPKADRVDEVVAQKFDQPFPKADRIDIVYDPTKKVYRIA